MAVSIRCSLVESVVLQGLLSVADDGWLFKQLMHHALSCLYT